MSITFSLTTDNTSIPNQGAMIDNLMIHIFFRPQSTTTLGPEDSGNGTLTVQDMKALQVIENVDFVKGKRTLVRTSLTFNNGTDPTPKTATIKLYLNNTLQQTSGNSTPTIQGGIQNVDLFFTPAPTISLDLEEYINGSLHLTDLIPVQVIQRVDLVKGKRTLVRTTLNYLPGTAGTRTATAKVLLLNQRFVW